MADLSVVLPTLDEGPLLPAALAALKGQAPEAEFVVADGGSKDATLAAARAGAHVLVRCRKAGRAFQLDQGARAASGRVLVFLHADTRLQDGWPAALADAFAALPTPAAASFRLRFDSPRPVFRLLERAADWRQAVTGVPQGDQGLAVLKDAYLASGGFPDVPLMEEYELALRLREQGRFARVPLDAVTSARRHLARGPLRTALRNSALVALWHLGASPARLARWYR
ncbi:MAG: TIGR04283 family arsenosugar biosynthesis glycosyltransferase [Elusimicrobia bacterium]|nr:TIGR04283 family arsenosugar biosynthesis glycosyltransferase [Elusimicrobiota bacterium]